MAQEIETYYEHNEPDENDESTWDKPQRKRVKLIVDLCLNVSQETPVDPIMMITYNSEEVASILDAAANANALPANFDFLGRNNQVQYSVRAKALNLRFIEN